jgi:hypothetical protein
MNIFRQGSITEKPVKKMGSTIYIILSFAWGLCILMSFTGWGSFLGRALFLKKDTNWGQRAIGGVAFSIFIGGLLNVFGAISKVTVISYVWGGVICFVLLDALQMKNYLINAPKKILDLWREDKAAIVAVLVVVILLFLSYLASAVPTQWNGHDDGQAYGIFPQKMLEQGSLGYEPFSQRRTGTLGGQSFLHTLVLCVLSNRQLHIIDPGIALIIVIALLWGLAKEFYVSKRFGLSICILFLCFPILIINTTSLVMGTALCLALFQAVGDRHFEDNQGIFRRAFIVALLIAALCASKINFAVFCGIYFSVSYGLYLVFESFRKTVAAEFVTAAVLILVFLLPWMIASYQSSGTLFFPFLGKGYSYPAFGLDENPPPTAYVLVESIYHYLYLPSTICLMAAFILGLRHSSKERVIWAGGICGSVIFSGIIINSFTPAYILKYSWAFFVAALAVLIFYAFMNEKGRQYLLFERGFYAFMILLMAPCFLRNSLALKFFDFEKNQISIQHYPKTEFIARSDLYPHKKVVSYSRAQNSIPERQTFLAMVSEASLLDFKRNQILIVDYLIPGPKPGMPIFQHGQAVAEYLLSQGIRYVMYSYSDEGGFRKSDLSFRLNFKDPWVRDQALLRFTLQDDLMELGKIKKKIFDDGDIFVLDLAQGNPEWTTKGYTHVER